MYQVKKRDGKITDFNLQKIAAAISKAFEAKEIETHPDIIDMLALKVTAHFSAKVKDGFVRVEDIQDSAEVVLIQAGYVEIAKSYILYRKQREKIRNMSLEELKAEEAYVGLVSLSEEVRNKFAGKKLGDTMEVNIEEIYPSEQQRAAVLKMKKEELKGLKPEFNFTITQNFHY